jgi:hypothetical protein
MNGPRVEEVQLCRAKQLFESLCFATFLVLLMACLPSPAIAASVTLMWDPSPDSNAVGYAVYYGTVGTPTPTRNDVGNTTNAPVNNLQPGLTYFFYVTAYDGARNESDPSNVINYSVPAATNSNTAPALGTLVDQTITATSNLTFTASATDVDVPAQTLTFSLDPGAPTGASLNPSTAVFSWTPTLAQTGTYQVAVRVTDSGSPALSASQTISITVNALPNTAPVLGTLANKTVTATSNLTFAAAATDADVPAQTLTFSLDAGAPAGASIDPVSGVFSWTPTRSQTGTFPVTVRVTDNGSPALSASQAISIAVSAPPNTAPAVGAIANQTVIVTSDLSFTVTATDVDLPPQTLTFRLRSGAPSGASINPNTGLFSWTPTVAQTGTFSVTVRVTDNGSPTLTTSRAFSITVMPAGVPPSITTLLTNQAACQGASVAFGVVASGTPAPGYRWQFNNSDLSGVTGSSLVLTNLQATNAGTYSVIVTNLYGATTSAAQLAVYPRPGPESAPRISLQPASQGGLSLSFTNLPGYQYLVQTNANLGSANWGTIATVSPAFSSGIVNVPLSTNNGPRLFYRVVVLSN